MTYQESIDFLFAQLPMFSRVGPAAYKPGLERSHALAAYFGNPEQRLRCIHVAGTNGKGSTSHLIASVLQEAGYKVALYTSPHLVDFRERMRINGEMIPREGVIDFVERWQASNYPGDRPSFFELTMMMAFDWFASQNVDYAVIEVGMGGRLDSTNIITPLLSVITNISPDHMQFLGDTLPKIAFEKAGIIKEGVPVVIGEAEGEIEAVFRAKAKEMDAPIREAYREIDAAANEALHCQLAGDYQKKNVNTARVAIDELRRTGVNIPEEATEKGFRNVEANTGLRGRWNIISRQPLSICDTGHNEAGLRYNMGQLARMLSERPGATLRMVIGFVADKDVEHILSLLPRKEHLDVEYYVSQAPIPRALPADQLKEKMEAAGFTVRAFPTVANAYETARAEAGSDDIIFIGGSTFIVADLLANI